MSVTTALDTYEQFDITHCLNERYHTSHFVQLRARGLILRVLRFRHFYVMLCGSMYTKAVNIFR